ncbi:helicase HerA-like domain-containing protein [Eggerthia catenaformis]|uniref:helicase HerA-like domain-containing protein n=1 Tax=Eggerthia catenaformis TaxID=31973 RepID=UPI003C6F1423
MYKYNKIWIGNNDKGNMISLLPQYANRHGLICGATGTGKTITLKVLAETFSEMGVPVFMADVKGDVSGMMKPGTDSADMQERIKKFKLDEAGFQYSGCPVTFWDIYGTKGIQLRTTISEMGPILLSRILDLNDLQSDILSVVFKIADDNQLLLIDTKDLKAMLNYVEQNTDQFQADYGKISSASIGVIIRSIVALESQGGDIFFGEPALNISEWLTLGNDGKGMINILDSSSLVNNGKLYSTFLLWLLSELFEALPEVGDTEKPKMVFFFDEAHLLFNDISKTLLTKIEQTVKLIRSKGVGVYFCTQNPNDIPNNVLAQLGNKIEHGLRAYTPADQKSVKAAAESFRVNPEFDTFDTILNLGIGEAVVSFIDENGIPSIAEKVNIMPPRCSFGAITDIEREQTVKCSLAYSRYAISQDPDSAYEFLQRHQEVSAIRKEEEKTQELAEKEMIKQEKLAAKEAERDLKARQKAVKSVGSTLAGTVGRELGKQAGKSFGSFGKTLGGNVGAQLARSILGTFFKG